ncbi:peptidase M16 [Limnothrix sp. P13C2]|nr:peptidase M16 [Limnothrix sp. P13C2]
MKVFRSIGARRSPHQFAAQPRRDRRWRWLAITLLVGLLVLGVRQPAVADTPLHYTELQLPPPPEVKLPDYDRFQLPNGLTVYLVEDHELPLVGGRAIVRTGSRWEPEDLAGLADVVGDVLRSGGTQQHDAATLDQLLEDRAASIESGIGIASGSVSFSALSEDLESVFGWFTEVLRSPAFAPEKIALAKTQLRGNIARRNDDPDGIASREFDKLLYGANSPYARTVEYATLDRIDRPAVESFYRRYFVPQNIILGISGDFDRTAMRRLIEARLGDWQPGPNRENPLPAVSQVQTSGVFVVDRPQLTQSSVVLGHLGGLVSNTDYPAMAVLNDVLNGFGGRLFNELRSRQGLAYSVYGYWSPNYDFPGTFQAGGQTRSEGTVPLIQGLKAEIAKVRSQPISNQELNFAKESALNSFIFNFADPSQTLGRLMTYDYYGYPSDFIFRYQKAVQATTIEDVQRAAQTYLKPDQLVTLVVGNQKSIQPPLNQLGQPVTALDVAIPGVPTGRNS